MFSSFSIRRKALSFDLIHHFGLREPSVSSVPLPSFLSHASVSSTYTHGRDGSEEHQSHHARLLPQRKHRAVCQSRDTRFPFAWIPRAASKGVRLLVPSRRPGLFLQWLGLCSPFPPGFRHVQPKAVAPSSCTHPRCVVAYEEQRERREASKVSMCAEETEVGSVASHPNGCKEWEIDENWWKDTLRRTFGAFESHPFAKPGMGRRESTTALKIDILDPKRAMRRFHRYLPAMMSGANLRRCAAARKAFVPV